MHYIPYIVSAFSIVFLAAGAYLLWTWQQYHKRLTALRRKQEESIDESAF